MLVGSKQSGWGWGLFSRSSSTFWQSLSSWVWILAMSTEWETAESFMVSATDSVSSWMNVDVRILSPSSFAVLAVLCGKGQQKHHGHCQDFISELRTGLVKSAFSPAHVLCQTWLQVWHGMFHDWPFDDLPQGHWVFLYVLGFVLDWELSTSISCISGLSPWLQDSKRVCDDWLPGVNFWLRSSRDEDAGLARGLWGRDDGLLMAVPGGKLLRAWVFSGRVVIGD